MSVEAILNIQANKSSVRKIFKKIQIRLEFQLIGYTITSFFILISNQRKNTPPQDAVIIPTGISIGAKIVLDTVSAAVRNDAPRRKEHGRMIRLSTPIIILRT